MIAGATEVPVVGRAFLSTVGWADAAVHIKHDHLRRATVMNAVDPSAGKITKRGEVFLGGQNFRLEAPHLTARGRLFRDSMAADDPSHDRVEAEPVGIVHVVVPAKAPENGLAELRRPRPWRPFIPVRRVSVSTSPAISAQFDRRHPVPGTANNPASEVTLEPWNSSLSRRSKSTRRHPCFDSPIGCAISADPYLLQLHDSYRRIRARCRQIT